MRSKNLNQAQRAEILARVLGGEKPAAVAEAFRVSAATVYGIRAAAGFATKRVSNDHLALQQQSMTPPEVYCHRAGIKLHTLRNYASKAEVRLALAGIAEKRAWWKRALTGVNPDSLLKACKAHDWPLIEAAKWLIDTTSVEGSWLFGFCQPIKVPLGKQAIEDMSHDTQPGDFIVVHGRTASYCPEALALHMLDQHNRKTAA